MSQSEISRFYTPFNPHPFDSYLNESLEEIPRYLFRVSDPSSLGITKQSDVCSEAARISPEPLRDLYQMPLQQAAQLLNTHLWGQCSHSDIDPCNLVSWTSSLLVALQYGFYCHGRGWKPQKLFDIKILMIDTRQFANSIFARDSQAIAAFKDASEEIELNRLYEWRNSGSFYSGEYLSQGKLIINSEKSCQVSMQELVSRGVLHVCPGFRSKSHWSRWTERVNELRNEWESRLQQIRATEVQAAIHVTMAFKNFEIPGAIMLLGLSPYDLSESVPTIVEVLAAAKSEQAIRSHVVSTGFITGANSVNLPELVRWKILCDSLKDELTLSNNRIRGNVEEADHENDETNDLADGLANLDIQADHTY